MIQCFSYLFLAPPNELKQLWYKNNKFSKDLNPQNFTAILTVNMINSKVHIFWEGQKMLQISTNIWTLNVGQLVMSYQIICLISVGWTGCYLMFWGWVINGKVPSCYYYLRRRIGNREHVVAVKWTFDRPCSIPYVQRTAMYSLLRKGTIIVPGAASSLTHALEWPSP